MCMLCQQSLARLGCGLYPLHAASQPEAVSMGGWVPRSLHHLERARHVCNGLSHASLQTVFSLQKLHTELDGGGLTNTLPQFPTGPVAFSQIDVQTAHTGWKHLSINTSTRMHRQKGKTHEQSLFAVSLHCLAFVDFSVRLTITIGQTKLPVVRGVLKTSLPT